MRIPDSKVAQFADLIDETGIPSLVEAALAARPGPPGLPVRTVLVALMLAIEYTGKASLAEATRLVAFSLSPTAQARLGLTKTTGNGDKALLALSRRFYRAFDRLTSLTDPARADRRRRLPRAEAGRLAAAWEDNDPDHLAKRELLQNIVTALVLAPVRRALARGALRGWNGDIGVDATAVACWARPPSERKGLASIEFTAGWHFSGGTSLPTFAYSAALAVAGLRRGRRNGRSHPQLALGLVLDTPGKRLGPNAIIILETLAALGLLAGLLVADRAYTDQKAAHFARPARKLGYKLVLDYKQDQRGVQGSVHGSPLIDGTPACPLIPAPLAHATTGLDDQTVRAPDDHLTALIAAREPYYLKLKQSPDARGALRLQCPGAGPSPALTCARFHRLHPTPTAPTPSPAPIDLTDPRRRAAHPAAKPTVLLPADEVPHPPPPDRLPRICRQQTITIAPGDLGETEKLRQDLHYLSDPWTAAYKAVRAQTEGLNGRLKGHSIDLADPKNRLAPGRCAQSILTALMVMIANLQIIKAWEQTRQPPDPIPDTTTDPATAQPNFAPPQHARPPPPGTGP